MIIPLGLYRQQNNETRKLSRLIESVGREHTSTSHPLSIPPEALAVTGHEMSFLRRVCSQRPFLKTHFPSSACHHSPAPQCAPKTASHSATAFRQARLL